MERAVDEFIEYSLGASGIAYPVCATIRGYGPSQRIGDSLQPKRISGRFGFMHSSSFDPAVDPGGPAIYSVALAYCTSASDIPVSVSDIFSGINYNGVLSYTTLCGPNVTNSERFTVLWRKDFLYNPLAIIKSMDTGSQPTITGEVGVEITELNTSLMHWRSLGYGMDHLGVIGFDLDVSWLPLSYFKPNNDCASGYFVLALFHSNNSSNASDNIPLKISGTVRLNFRCADEDDERIDTARLLGRKFSKF